MNRDRVEALTVWAVALVPAVFTLWVIVTYGVNVPFMDEWRFPGELGKLASGQNILETLWSQNNEHRILFPRLLGMPILYLTAYDSRALLLLTWLLTGMLLALFWLALRRTSAAGDRLNMLLPLLLTSIFLFSLVHVAIWTNAFQYTFVMTNAAACLGLFVWCLHEIPVRKRLLVGSVAFFIASFSSLHGYLGWPIAIVLIPLVVGRGRRLRSLAVLAGGLLVSVSLNFYRHIPAGQHASDPTAALHDPVAALYFYLCLAGAPLIQGIGTDPKQLALVSGAMLVCGFTIAVAIVLRRRQEDLIPLCALGLFSMGFLAMTAVGRMSWGTGVAASTSRYMPQSVLLLGAVICISWRLTVNTRWRGWLTVSYAVLLALSLMGNMAGLNQIRVISSSRATAASLLPFIDDIAPETDDSRYGPLFPLYSFEPNGGTAVRLHYPPLLKLGFRPPSRRASFNAAPQEFFGKIESVSPTELTLGQITTLSGWAVLPELERPASFVVITRNDERLIVGAASVGTLKLPWLANYFEVPAYVNGGWKLDLPARFFHPGANTIRAWVHEPASGEFMLLHSPQVIQVTEAN